MAETGSVIALTDEVNTATTGGNAETLISGNGLSSSPGSVSVDFVISLDFTKVTLVSMIAPSPDWFVGVSGLELFEDGNWVREKAVDLYAYDAGSDSGTDYTSDNLETDPKEGIAKLTTGVFYVNGEVPKLGTFTFKKK
jgi:hypothetical protein